MDDSKSDMVFCVTLQPNPIFISMRHFCDPRSNSEK